jgi:hypothetical protein
MIGGLDQIALVGSLGRRGKALVIGVQSDRVAYTVTDDGDESIGPDAEFWLEDSSTVLSGQCSLERTVFAREINQRTLGAGPFHGMNDERTIRSMLTGISVEHEHLYLRISRGQGSEGLIKDRLIEFPGPIQIGHPNLEPADGVLEGTHRGVFCVIKKEPGPSL